MASESPRRGIWRTGSASSSSLGSSRSRLDHSISLEAIMKAAHLNVFGGPEVVTIGEAHLRNLQPGDAVVRVEVASANPLDLKVIAGYMQQVFPVEFPYVPGTDFSGVVDAVGTEVTDLRDRKSTRL